MILKEINTQYLTEDQVKVADSIQKVIHDSVQVLEPELVAHLMRQSPPATGPRVSQDPCSSVLHLFLHPPSSACQVPPARTREVSPAAGSAQQEAEPVTRGRKRTGSKHGEDVPHHLLKLPELKLTQTIGTFVTCVAEVLLGQMALGTIRSMFTT